MPDIVNHYLLSMKVRQTLHTTFRNMIHLDVYALAALGPDPWFCYRFWCPPLKYGRDQRGSAMHDSHTGAFLRGLAGRVRSVWQTGKREEGALLFSYLAGHICHYALDSIAHPYIIYRTGLYKETRETLVYRGGHMAFERALDLEALKKEGMPLKFTPILGLKRLPASLYEHLNALYSKIYGWKNAARDFNACIAHQRLLYTLIRDPKGFLDRFLNRFDNGRSRIDLRVVSYHGKERGDADVWNHAHKPWRNPWAPELCSTQSFSDLLDDARQKALRMIEACGRYMQSGSSKDLEEVLGNRSYSTGLDLEDPRRSNRPVFASDPFVYKKHFLPERS